MCFDETHAHIFEAILAMEFTSHCVSLNELDSNKLTDTILELNWKQSHGVSSFRTVVVRGPDLGRLPAACVSRFVGHGSSWAWVYSLLW